MNVDPIIPFFFIIPICNEPFPQQEQIQCLEFNIVISLWKQPLQLIP